MAEASEARVSLLDHLLKGETDKLVLRNYLSLMGSVR